MAKIKVKSSGERRTDRSNTKVAGSKDTELKTTTSYLSRLCDELEKAADGLLYPYSEGSDSYHFFSLHERNLSEANAKLTVLEFLGGFGLSDELIDEFKIPVDQFIEVRTLDEFFPKKDDESEAGNLKQYRILKSLLRKRLDDVKVFRVGRVDVRCYIAGFTKPDNIAGLVTTCIET